MLICFLINQYVQSTNELSSVTCMTCKSHPSINRVCGEIYLLCSALSVLVGSPGGELKLKSPLERAAGV